MSASPSVRFADWALLTEGTIAVRASAEGSRRDVIPYPPSGDKGSG